LVESDSVVPKHAEVIIVGGGIIGVSTTYFLAERRVRVVLCERKN
jgi:glycine/D-amino acid oxidase-like deaminating enzyme